MTINVSFLIPPRHSRGEWRRHIKCLDYAPGHLWYEAKLGYDVTLDDKNFKKKDGRNLWLEHKVTSAARFFDSKGKQCHRQAEEVREYWSLPDGKPMHVDDFHDGGQPGVSGPVICDDQCEQVGNVHGKLRIVYLKPKGGDDEFMFLHSEEQHYTGQNGQHDEYHGTSTEPSTRDTLEGFGNDDTGEPPDEGWAEVEEDNASALNAAFGTAEYEYSYAIEHCGGTLGDPAAPPKGGGTSTPGGEQGGGPSTPGGKSGGGPITPKDKPAQDIMLPRPRFRQNNGPWQPISTVALVRSGGGIFVSVGPGFWKPAMPGEWLFQRSILTPHDSPPFDPRRRD